MLSYSVDKSFQTQCCFDKGDRSNFGEHLKTDINLNAKWYCRALCWSILAFISRVKFWGINLLWCTQNQNSHCFFVNSWETEKIYLVKYSAKDRSFSCEQYRISQGRLVFVPTDRDTINQNMIFLRDFLENWTEHFKANQTGANFFLQTNSQFHFAC